MIIHIVLFKWQPATSPEAIAQIMQELGNLQMAIPEILEISCGENFTERSQGFQHGLLVKFSDRPALNTYQIHPAHQAVVQNLIKPVIQDILALDYEV